jgi:phosphoenolpyruvate carboxylase
MRNLEVQVSALLGCLARPTPPDRARWLNALDALAAESRRAWRDLVTNPRLPNYLDRASPLPALSGLHIGSRPASRPGRAGWEGLRAIPLVFSWTQNRHLLPAWYGVGAALERAPAAARRDLAACPFWNVFLDFVEMALAKSDPAVASRYAALASPPVRDAVWPAVRAEHARTVREVLRARGRRELLEGEPTLARSIALRNPYLDVLAHAQVALLGRLARRGRLSPAAGRTLALTVHGIAAGMRNTG